MVNTARARLISWLGPSRTIRILLNYAIKRNLFAEVCHDLENTIPVEATSYNDYTVRYVAWIGDRVGQHCSGIRASLPLGNKYVL